jgi:hypothetical protein
MFTVSAVALSNVPSLMLIPFPETPILGGAKGMMRRSTIKALETRRDEVITERKQQSKMRTLGASNPHNNNKDKHRDGIHKILCHPKTNFPTITVFAFCMPKALKALFDTPSNSIGQG